MAKERFINAVLSSTTSFTTPLNVPTETQYLIVDGSASYDINPDNFIYGPDRIIPISAFADFGNSTSTGAFTVAFYDVKTGVITRIEVPASAATRVYTPSQVEPPAIYITITISSGLIIRTPPINYRGTEGVNFFGDTVKNLVLGPGQSISVGYAGTAMVDARLTLLEIIPD